MYNEAKVLKIHSLFTEQKEAISSKSDEIINNLEKLNSYLTEFKYSVLKSTIEISLSLIEKAAKQKIFYSEFLFGRMTDILKNAFVFDNIIIYISPEDFNILNMFYSDRISSLDQLRLEPAENLSRGDCFFEFDFSEVKSRVVQRSNEIKLLLLEYSKKNLIKFPNKGTEKTSREIPAMASADWSIKSFGILDEISPDELSRSLEIENPKIIAYILINLKPEKSKEIFTRFNDILQYKIIENLLTINRIPQKLIQSIGKAAVSLLNNHSEKSLFVEKNQ
jgi:hypothetical protein